MMSSSKGICFECDICYLQEIGHIQEACNPKCYEEEPELEAQQAVPESSDEQPRTNKNA
ncbi:MAG: hypothetical protein KME31_30560 [Tolypothrix carrinoi HA7290-LM1]|nr:hypothetical protein [Tolypothrix carrinoi HA7290-LM1]